MSEVDSLRSITALPRESLRGIEPATIKKILPKLEWVDPKSLFVEESYQRDVRENGIKLIRKIYAGFSWSRFKPPICVRLAGSGNVLVCVDGQHTATAAASHPGIEKIPVFVVPAEDVADRAAAFVGHNRDRLGLTQMAIFYAELASGDPVAQVIDRACKAAGAKILNKSVNLKNQLEPGATIAVGTIRAIAKKQGEEALTRVLTLLTKAGRGPIKADEIAAVSLIFAAIKNKAFDPKLCDLVKSKSAEQWAALASAAIADTREPLPSALASQWCRMLGVRLSGTGMKADGKGSAKRMIENGQALRAEPLPSEPAPVAKPAPQPIPKPVRQSPPPADRPAAVIRNGVVVDFEELSVSHRHGTVTLADDGARLIGELAKVMPSLLEKNALARKLFGTDASGTLWLSQLVDRINPLLVRARLEVKTIPKMGYSLYDLGPAARD